MVNEIQKQLDRAGAPYSYDLLTLLADFRAERTSLQEFYMRIRVLVGAVVLMAAVQGLLPPMSDGTMQDHRLNRYRALQSGRPLNSSEGQEASSPAAADASSVAPPTAGDATGGNAAVDAMVGISGLEILANAVSWAELGKGNHAGGGSERQEPHLPVSPPGSLDPDQDSMTPRQRALHVARQHLKIVHTDAEREQVLHTLAMALGASRIEGGTIKALHAVLLTLERPEMSDKQAYTSTGGSLSNFKKWRRKVQHAQLDLPAP